MKIINKIINKIKITIWLIKIGDGFVDKIKLLKWLFVPNQEKNVDIKLKAFGRSGKLTLPNNRDQLMTLKGVFLNDDWGIEEKINPKTIFDLGAYTGISTMYFLLKYPDATIYSFEPNMESYTYLIKNYEGNPRVVLNNIAIADKNGEINLYTPNNRTLSSSIVYREGSVEGKKIISKTFDDICVNIDKIDLLKFNIEGGEINIFNSKSFFNKTKIFVGEVHSDLIPPEISLNQFKNKISNCFFITEKYMTKIGRGIWLGKTKK